MLLFGRSVVNYERREFVLFFPAEMKDLEMKINFSV